MYNILVIIAETTISSEAILVLIKYNTNNMNNVMSKGIKKVEQMLLEGIN